MSTVKWLVVRCRMYLFRLPDYPIPIDQVAIWRFGNRTKYIRHRTTSHLTANISDRPPLRGRNTFYVLLLKGVAEKAELRLRARQRGNGKDIETIRSFL